VLVVLVRASIEEHFRPLPQLLKLRRQAARVAAQSAVQVAQIHDPASIFARPPPNSLSSNAEMKVGLVSARVILLEGSDHVLGTFPDGLAQQAADQLQRLGVEVRTACRVTAIDDDGIDYETASGTGPPSTHRLPTKTVIWAAGVAGAPLGRMIAGATGATLDRAARLVVMPDLSVPKHPDISVVGDLAAAFTDYAGASKPVPGVGAAAKQMGRTAAGNLLRRLRGEPTRPFRYIDYGNLATIGRRAAVVDLPVRWLGPVRFGGFAAWLFWLFAHVYFLIGFRNRLNVMTEWAWAYFTYERPDCRGFACGRAYGLNPRPPGVPIAVCSAGLRRPRSQTSSFRGGPLDTLSRFRVGWLRPHFRRPLSEVPGRSLTERPEQSPPAARDGSQAVRRQRLVGAVPGQADPSMKDPCAQVGRPPCRDGPVKGGAIWAPPRLS
jgi:hypothetical protein